MNTNDKYKNYSAGDIFKYLRGELSPGEMQSLEAAALEDPFLADALEGMQNDRSRRGEEAFREDLTGLKQRLDNRIRKKDKAVILFFSRSAWKVAAAILLLAGLGTITFRYFLNGPSSKMPLASAGKNITTTDTLAGGRLMPNSPEKTDSGKMITGRATGKDDVALAKEPASQVETSASQKAGNSDYSTTNGEDHHSRDAEAAKFKKLRMDTASLALNSMPSPLNQATPAPFNSSQPDSASKRGRTNKYRFSGKVIDGNNNPIPLVTLFIQGHRQPIRTDSSGLFRVQLLGSDSSAHITISSAGYETVSMTVDAPSDDDAVTSTIRLRPQNNALGEEVEIGYDTQSKLEKDKDLPGEDRLRKEASGRPSRRGIVQQGVPAGDWAQYKSYLEKNKHLATIDSTKKGTEAISFKINKAGKLSSFKIEQSLSPAHDSLLLRLIRQGPGWKPNNGKNTRVIVTLSY